MEQDDKYIGQLKSILPYLKIARGKVKKLKIGWVAIRLADLISGMEKEIAFVKKENKGVAKKR